MRTNNVRVTGVMFYYYFVCKRKLWYFYHDITMEHNSEDVAIGKLIDKSSYKREKKQILIDGIINIDFIDGGKVIHEIKKSRSIEEAGEWQLKYYLCYLKEKGIEGVTGLVDYPLLKKRKKIELTSSDEIKIEEVIKDIENTVTNIETPKLNNKRICKKCSYYELCFI